MGVKNGVPQAHYYARNAQYGEKGWVASRESTIRPLQAEEMCDRFSLAQYDLLVFQTIGNRPH